MIHEILKRQKEKKDIFKKIRSSLAEHKACKCGWKQQNPASVTYKLYQVKTKQ